MTLIVVCLAATTLGGGLVGFGLGWTARGARRGYDIDLVGAKRR